VYEALAEDLRASRLVDVVHGEVSELALDSATGVWTAQGQSAERGAFGISGRALVLATGAEPRTLPVPEAEEVTMVDNELALDLPQLRETLQQGGLQRKRVVVGVVGNSHSGVLVLENLHALGAEGMVDEVRVVSRLHKQLAAGFFTFLFSDI